MKVKLFGREIHNTKNWNPVHHAIHKKQLSTVKRFIEEFGENPRLATRYRDKLDVADQDIFPLELACSNQDLSMFKYFWEMHYLWDSSHLYSIIEVIFTKTTWADVLKYLM